MREGVGDGGESIFFQHRKLNCKAAYLFLRKCRTQGGGGKRGTCPPPPEATTRHTLPPEKKLLFILSLQKRHAKKMILARVAHSNPIPTRLQSVKMVGH